MKIEKTINKGFFRFFKVNGEDYEFMYLAKERIKEDLTPFIEMVKGQGDIYRITNEKGGYVIWDSRYP